MNRRSPKAAVSPGEGARGGGGRAARRGAPGGVGGDSAAGSRGRLCIFMRSLFRFASQEGAAAAASPGGASLPPRPRSAADGGRRLRGVGSPGWVPPCRSPSSGLHHFQAFGLPAAFEGAMPTCDWGAREASRGCREKLEGAAGPRVPGRCSGAGGSRGSAPASGRSLAASVRGIPSLAVQGVCRR